MKWNAFILPPSSFILRVRTTPNPNPLPEAEGARGADAYLSSGVVAGCVAGVDFCSRSSLFPGSALGDVESGRLLALFSATAALAMLWMVWLTTRAERERDPVLRAWHRLDARYARLGLGRAPHEPASRWAERVSLAGVDTAGQLRELSWRFNSWRYAGPEPGSGASALIKALDRHRPGHLHRRQFFGASP